MRTLFKRNQLLFALLWIGLYVFSFSVADSISEGLGVRSFLSAPLGVLMSILLIGWITSSNLIEYFGLCKITSPDYKTLLFFLPLVVIASANLWHGANMKYSALEAALSIVKMISVGVIEEILFRGFLFRAIARKRVKLAIVISSVTFGLGHLVNLLNGADILQTLLQICYAIALGYLFTVLFIKTKSLLPCMIAHGVLNALGVFSAGTTLEQDVVASAILIVISFGYAAFIEKKYKQVGSEPHTAV